MLGLETLYLLGKICGAITACIGIPKGLLWLYRKIKRMDDVVGVLSEIATEFKPNGGHSLKDSITKLEKSVSALDTKTDAFITYQKDRNRSINGHLAVIRGFQVFVAKRIGIEDSLEAIEDSFNLQSFQSEGE